MSLRVAVVGGGIAGAAVAALLGRRNHAVEVFERRHEPGGGGGLLLAPPALALLRLLGLEDAARARGTRVTSLRAKQARGGKTMLDWDVRRRGYECLGLGMERRVLHELLHQAAATQSVLRHGLGVDAVNADTGWLRDSDGMLRGPYDLLVACDGASSRLRAAEPALVKYQRRYTWTAFSCLMRCPADAPPRTALEQVFRGTHHVSNWPVGPAGGGGQTLCVSANVPAASAAQFFTAGDGLAELQRLGLGGTLQPLRAAGPWIALSCGDVALHRLFRQRLVFVGDAAHSLSPQLGQGTRLALAGAVNLDLALSRYPVAEALAVYCRRQRALAAGYQRWSRRITPLFQSPCRGLYGLRDCVLGPLSRLAPVQRGILRLLCGSPDTGNRVSGHR